MFAQNSATYTENDFQSCQAMNTRPFQRKLELVESNVRDCISVFGKEYRNKSIEYSGEQESKLLMLHSFRISNAV